MRCEGCDWIISPGVTKFVQYCTERMLFVFLGQNLAIGRIITDGENASLAAAK
jgi:hypothetical protein